MHYINTITGCFSTIDEDYAEFGQRNVSLFFRMYYPEHTNIPTSFVSQL